MRRTDGGAGRASRAPAARGGRGGAGSGQSVPRVADLADVDLCAAVRLLADGCARAGAPDPTLEWERFELDLGEGPRVRHLDRLTRVGPNQDDFEVLVILPIPVGALKRFVLGDRPRYVRAKLARFEQLALPNAIEDQEVIQRHSLAPTLRARIGEVVPYPFPERIEPRLLSPVKRSPHLLRGKPAGREAEVL